MLVSFSVKNYRSFGEEVTLNMVANNKLAHHPGHRIPIGDTGKYLLRTSVLYGANAAGKSNLVRAMAFAQGVIKSSESLHALEPFRFGRDWPRQPSSFEFRFLLGGRVFVYGFDVTSREVDNEWLALQTESDEVEIFERDADGIATINRGTRRFFSDDPILFNTLEVLSKLPVRKNQLFLNRASALPDVAQGQTLGKVVRWLTEDLLILEAEHRACDILDRLDRDGRFRSFSSEFLASVGTGVGSLAFEKNEREASEWERNYLCEIMKAGSFPNSAFDCTGDMDILPKHDDPTRVVERRLLATHPVASDAYRLPFCEESAGTQQLLHLMPVLSAGQGKVVVIDELDRSLHPLVCWEFIRFFSESCPGARRQLIVTTHEAHLLNQELLRRDEYWFVEKDAQQQSRLVALSEFNVRNDLQVEKGYLQGRFGAIPVIGPMDSLERLLECQTVEPEHAAQEATA
jgi:hypothetical protein